MGRTDHTQIKEQISELSRTELRGRIHRTVTNADTLEIDLVLSVLVVLVNRVRASRNPFSCVTLSGDVKIVASKRRIHGKELRQRRDEFVSDLCLIRGISVLGSREGETRTDWIVQEKQMVILIPTHLSFLDRTLLISDIERSDLREHSEHRRRSGSSLKPQKNRCVRCFLDSSGEPEERVGIVFLVDSEEAGGLFRYVVSV